MQKSIYPVLITIFILLFSSCRKDSFTESTTTIPPDVIEVNFVESKVQGVIVDEDNNALSEVYVSWGENSSYTDENGVFILNGTVRDRQARLEISKPGYFTSTQILQTKAGESIRTKVKMIRRELSASFSSETETTVETNGEAKIEFAANGFTNQDGSSYAGDVLVYAFYLDPSRDDLSEIMTGNLLASNTENELRVLQSYGMINVEIEDPQGNSLNISKPAKITSPVPEKLRANAAASIPLWYYDLEDDLWKEDGEAILEGNVYVGEVNHFTWWNCDVPSEFVFLSGCLNQIRGSYWDHYIRLTILSTGASAVVSVTQEGSFSGFVPKGEQMILEVFNTCYDVVHTETIGGFEENTVLPKITVLAPPEQWHTISGTLINCNDEPVTNGYVSINYANQNRIIFLDEEGSFSEAFPECVDDFVRITAIDLDELKSSAIQTAILDSDIELDVFKACDELQGEFSITLGGVSILGKPCTMTIESISPTQERYDVTLVHPQDNGTVIYVLYISNSDIDDPLNWSSIGFQDNQRIVQGNPEIIFDFSLQGAINQIILENSRQPGDIFHFVGKLNAENITTGQILENADLDIKALIL